MKTKTPKKPAAKPAKIPKPTPAPVEAPANPPPPPMAQPQLPPDRIAAVRPLLDAVRFLDEPGAPVPEAVARFVRWMDEWEARKPEWDAADAALRADCPEDDPQACPPPDTAWCEWRIIEETAGPHDWKSYRCALVSRLTRETIRRALAALAGLSPAAAQAAADSARPYFALAGVEAAAYHAIPLPLGEWGDEAGNARFEILRGRIDDALARLAARAKNPPPPASKGGKGRGRNYPPEVKTAVLEWIERERGGDVTGEGWRKAFDAFSASPDCTAGIRARVGSWAAFKRVAEAARKERERKKRRTRGQKK